MAALAVAEIGDGQSCGITPRPDGLPVTAYRELQEGRRVSFDVTQGQKDAQAENIVPA